MFMLYLNPTGFSEHQCYSACKRTHIWNIKYKQNESDITLAMSISISGSTLARTNWCSFASLVLLGTGLWLNTTQCPHLYPQEGGAGTHCTYLMIIMTTTIWKVMKYSFAASWVTRANPLARSRKLRTMKGSLPYACLLTSPICQVRLQLGM